MYIWLKRVHSAVMCRKLALNSEDHFPLMFEYIFDATWYWRFGPVTVWTKLLLRWAEDVAYKMPQCCICKWKMVFSFYIKGWRSFGMVHSTRWSSSINGSMKTSSLTLLIWFSSGTLGAYALSNGVLHSLMADGQSPLASQHLSFPALMNDQSIVDSISSVDLLNTSHNQMRRRAYQIYDCSSSTAVAWQDIWKESTTRNIQVRRVSKNHKYALPYADWVDEWLPEGYLIGFWDRLQSSHEKQ